MSDEDNEDSKDYVDPRPVAPSLVWFGLVWHCAVCTVLLSAKILALLQIFGAEPNIWLCAKSLCVVYCVPEVKLFTLHIVCKYTALEN